MSKEHEGKFNTARKYRRFISIGLIGLGGLFARRYPDGIKKLKEKS